MSTSGNSQRAKQVQHSYPWFFVSYSTPFSATDQAIECQLHWPVFSCGAEIARFKNLLSALSLEIESHGSAKNAHFELGKRSQAAIFAKASDFFQEICYKSPAVAFYNEIPPA